MEHLRDRALAFLKSLEADAALIPEALRPWWLEYRQGHIPRYLDTLEFMDRHGLGGTMLELGSVPGHFTVLLKNMGYDVRGIDLDPSRIARFLAKYDVPVDRVDIERDPLPFDEETFDFVLFSEMLEHLRINPLHALREIHRVLKPGGHILLTTPNISPVDRLLFLLGKDYQEDPVEEFSRLEWLGHMGHLRLYSVKDVRSFLEAVGFTVTSHVYRGPLRGGWKGSLLRLLDPQKGRWRTHQFALGQKH